MRRTLRMIASNDTINLGDISILLNPEVVKGILDGVLVSAGSAQKTKFSFLGAHSERTKFQVSKSKLESN